jgi:hypothetical protein
MRTSFLAVLDALASEMPSTPIVLVSGLAAGADQLAAQWALEWAGSQPPLDDGAPRLSLVAALPLAKEDYAGDFVDDPEARTRLDALLGSAAFRITLDAGGEFSSDRDAAYVRLGSFIAEQSQMVVAFWDGVRTLKRGGTYHVIQKCLRTDPDAAPLDLEFHRRRHLLIAPTDVDVRVIRVRRRSGAAAPASPPALDAAPTEAERERHADYRARLDRLNRVLLVGMPHGPAASAQDAVRQRFQAVDSLATRMKRVFLRHVSAMSVITVAAIGCFQVFNFMASDLWAALYLILTVSLVVWFLILRHFSSVEWVFVYARAISEAMRVQLAWNDSGVGDRVCDQYMSRRSFDVGVLRQMVTASSLETRADGVRAPHGPVLAGPAMSWVEGQRQYMAARIAGTPSKPFPVNVIQSMLRAVVRYHWFLIVGTAAVLWVIAWMGGRGGDGASGASDAQRLLPMGFLLIGSVLFLKSGLEYHDSAVLQREDIDRFRRMLPVYEKASAMLSVAPCDAERRRILNALGKEAIDENAEWFVKHTDALKLPTVG